MFSYLDVCQAHLMEKYVGVPKPENMRKPMLPLRTSQGLKPRAQCFVDNTQEPHAVRDKVPAIYQQHLTRRVNDLATLLAGHFKYPRDTAQRITKVCTHHACKSDSCMAPELSVPLHKWLKWCTICFARLRSYTCMTARCYLPDCEVKLG
jgi:hypothetical protein